MGFLQRGEMVEGLERKKKKETEKFKVDFAFGRKGRRKSLKR